MMISQMNLNFSLENLKLIEDILKKYPEKNKKSAVMPFTILSSKTKSKLDTFSSNEIYS